MTYLVRYTISLDGHGLALRYSSNIFQLAPTFLSLRSKEDASCSNVLRRSLVSKSVYR